VKKELDEAKSKEDEEKDLLIRHAMDEREVLDRYQDVISQTLLSIEEKKKKFEETSKQLQVLQAAEQALLQRKMESKDIYNYIEVLETLER
jgi:hypothetical protein